jgi:UDP-N-acetylmuramate--alanine ligase
MDLDHPDCYPTAGDLRTAFAAFVARIRPDGWLVASADDPEVSALAAAHRGGVVTYGLGADRPWRAEDIRLGAAGGSTFDLVSGDGARTAMTLSVPGRHNVSNALAASSLAGVDLPSATGILAGFRGVKRRFEVVGEALGAVLVDDYAHHPAEIRATLAAARARYPGHRIVAVHQPHTYSRLKALLSDFAAAFSDADVVMITDIYASRESDTLGVHARDLVASMTHPDVQYVGGLPEATARLQGIVKPGDVVITLGAGNVNSVLPALMASVK